MGLALAVSGGLAYLTAFTPAMTALILGNQIVFWGLVIAQLGLVIWLSWKIESMSATTAMMVFLGYAALTGLTLASIFIVYTLGSIASTFFVTAGTFGLMSAYGYFTKTDLSSWGNIFFMALIGIILASLVNFFLQSEALMWFITYVGVIIFVGLTAYDTQRIKHMATASGDMDDESTTKYAIHGALALYLDFINLFLYLLRIFGERR